MNNTVIDMVCKHLFEAVHLILFGYNNQQSYWVCGNCYNLDLECPPKAYVLKACFPEWRMLLESGGIFGGGWNSEPHTLLGRHSTT
jgi:hypothetical protein